MTRTRARRHALLGVAMAWGMTGQAHAGGFMLAEQSQREIGRAFSGGAAAADDPSTIFYNPAGMTELPGLQINTGATALFIESRQQNDGSTMTALVPFGPFPGVGARPSVGGLGPITGNNGGNPFKPVAPVPTTYVSAQVGQSGFWLGLGVSAPYGLKLTYDPGFFGRYDSIHSKLLTLNVQPSIAYRLSDAVSIGGGLDVQYADAKLTNALAPVSFVPLTSPVEPIAKVNGDDISFGWNAGVLVKLKHGLRFGLHYRSGITHQLKGDNVMSLSSETVQTSFTVPIRAPLRLPDSVTASVSLPLDGKTRFMATGRYFNWSRFKSISVYLTQPLPVPVGSPPTVRGAGTSTPIAIKAFDYRDSWSLSFGIDHAVSERLTVRAGGMFDRTPTNPALLSTRVPDGDRRWLTTGLSYRLSPRLTLNASYAHVFIDKQTMDRTELSSSGPMPVAITTRSQSSGNVDMIATSVTARF